MSPATIPASRLDELEAVIEGGIQTYIAVGQALCEIRDSRLYQLSHGTFEAYCRDRWRFSRQYAYNLIQASAVVAELSTQVDGAELPTNERQTRALAAVPADQRAAVWQAARETAGDQAPTPNMIREAAGTAPTLKITSAGLRIEGPINQETLTEAFRELKQGKDGFHCALADLVRVGCEQVGQDAVDQALADLEYDHADAVRAAALNSLPPAARELGLTAGHYVVVTQAKELDTEAQRMAWLTKAKNHGLTPLQLRRSITAGRVVTSEEINLASGRNSGMDTIENVMFMLKRWKAQVDKLDPIKDWTREKKDAALSTLQPFYALIKELAV